MLYSYQSQTVAAVLGPEVQSQRLPFFNLPDRTKTNPRSLPVLHQALRPQIRSAAMLKKPNWITTKKNYVNTTVSTNIIAVIQHQQQQSKLTPVAPRERHQRQPRPHNIIHSKDHLPCLPRLPVTAAIQLGFPDDPRHFNNLLPLPQGCRTKHTPSSFASIQFPYENLNSNAPPKPVVVANFLLTIHGTVHHHRVAWTILVSPTWPTMAVAGQSNCRKLVINHGSHLIRHLGLPVNWNGTNTMSLNNAN